MTTINSYAIQRLKAARGGSEAAGGEVVAVEHGRLVTAVEICVDDYGNQVYLTSVGPVRPLTRAQCKSI